MTEPTPEFERFAADMLDELTAAYEAVKPPAAPVGAVAPAATFGAPVPFETRIDSGDEADDPGVHVLQRLADADSEFDFTRTVGQWRNRGCMSPRQMSLIAWRLAVHNIAHNPSDFKVDTTSVDGRRAALDLRDFQKRQLLPYLTEQQKHDLGF